MKNINKIPSFKNIKDEASFWDRHDINNYLPKIRATKVTYSARLTKEETVVVRLQKNLKKRLEVIAKNNDVSLSTLLRSWCIEKANS